MRFEGVGGEGLADGKAAVVVTWEDLMDIAAATIEERPQRSSPDSNGRGLLAMDWQGHVQYLKCFKEDHILAVMVDEN